jgi:hypothetical protein
LFWRSQAVANLAVAGLVSDLAGIMQTCHFFLPLQTGVTLTDEHLQRISIFLKYIVQIDNYSIP